MLCEDIGHLSVWPPNSKWFFLNFVEMEEIASRCSKHSCNNSNSIAEAHLLSSVVGGSFLLATWCLAAQGMLMFKFQYFTFKDSFFPPSFSVDFAALQEAAVPKYGNSMSIYIWLAWNYKSFLLIFFAETNGLSDEPVLLMLCSRSALNFKAWVWATNRNTRHTPILNECIYLNINAAWNWTFTAFIICSDLS